MSSLCHMVLIWSLAAPQSAFQAQYHDDGPKAAQVSTPSSSPVASPAALGLYEERLASALSDLKSSMGEGLGNQESQLLDSVFTELGKLPPELVLESVEEVSAVLHSTDSFEEKQTRLLEVLYEARVEVRKSLGKRTSISPYLLHIIYFSTILAAFGMAQLFFPNRLLADLQRLRYAVFLKDFALVTLVQWMGWGTQYGLHLSKEAHGFNHSEVTQEQVLREWAVLSETDGLENQIRGLLDEVDALFEFPEPPAYEE